jgi:branched-chain amino acid transport system permease protein
MTPSKGIIAGIVVLGLGQAGGLGGEFTAFAIALGLVYVVAVLGIHVLLNDAGQVSLAHGAFVATGAFAAAHVQTALGANAFVVALLVGAAAGGAASGVVALPVLRLHGFTAAITTWLFVIAVDRFLFAQQWFVGPAGGVEVPAPRFASVDFSTSRSQLVLAMLVAGAAAAVAVRLRASRLGRSLLAVRSNEAMAACVGIDVRRAKVGAYVIAGAFAGLAGGLWVLILGRAVPSSFPPVLSVTFLAIAIVGGRGSIWGPAIIAFLFSSGPQLFGALGRTMLYLSALLPVLVLVRFPGGLNEQARSVSRAVSRRGRAA